MQSLNDVELHIDDVKLLVIDDDTPSVIVHPTKISLAPGQRSQYWVSLATRPESSSQVGLSYVSTPHFNVESDHILVFNQENWFVKQNVVVEGKRSGIPGHHNISIDHVVRNYGDIDQTDSVDISMREEVDVEVELIVSPTQVTLNEGTSRQYSVVLDAQPEQDLVVKPRHQAAAHLTTGEALVFSPSNWNIEQHVTVSAIQDADARDHEILISHDIESEGASTTGPSVVISIHDDDTREVLISKAELRIPEGSFETYSVVLATKPSTDVLVTATSDDSAVVDLFAELTFTPTNWDSPVEVVVDATRDGDALDENVAIHHRVSGYGEVTMAPSVDVLVYDSNVAGVTVSPTLLQLVEGESVTYSVVLGSEPSRSVEITPSSMRPDLVEVEHGVIFTSDNWSVPQNITIRALEDRGHSNEHVSIRHAVSGYESIDTAPSVVVSLQDNDIAASDLVLEKVARTIADQSVSAISRRAKSDGSSSGFGQSISNSLRAGTSDRQHGYDAKRVLAAIEFSLDSLTCPSTQSTVEAPTGDGTLNWFCRFPISVWGNGDYQRISSDYRIDRFTGGSSTFNLGIDIALSDAWLVGFLASSSAVSADVLELGWTQKYSFDITNFYVYAKALYPTFDGWVTTGRGTGTLDIQSPSSSLSYSSPIETSTSALGGRALVKRFRSYDLSVKGQTMWTSLSVLGTELDGAGVVKSHVDATRSRLALEASKLFRRTDQSGSLRPEIQLGLRHDGGSSTGDEKMRAEIITGIGYRDASGRIKLSSHVNFSNVLANGEWGGSIQFEIEPFEGGHGFSFRFRPIYGLELTNVVDLWSRNDSSNQSTSAVNRQRTDYRVQSFMGYGFTRQHWVVTPYISIETSDNARSSKVGTSWRTLRDEAIFGLYLENLTRSEPGSNDIGLKIEFRARL